MLFEFVRTWKCYVFFIRKFGSSDKENKEIYKQVLNYEQDTVSEFFPQLIFYCRSNYDVKILNSLVWELAQVCFKKKLFLYQEFLNLETLLEIKYFFVHLQMNFKLVHLCTTYLHVFLHIFRVGYETFERSWEKIQLIRL